MPELPEMAALAERLDRLLARAVLERIDVLSFSSLKTAAPAHGELTGLRIEAVSSRGKFGVVAFEGGMRLALHLGQAGRVRLEERPGPARPRGGVVRLLAAGRPAVLVVEASKERKAGWWVLGPGDDGPLAGLGPEANGPEATALVRASTANRQLHAFLRDQHELAGIGRGYADDVCHEARLSPFAIVARLDEAERDRLAGAIGAVLAAALDRERTREGGLAEGDLGDRFAVHRRAGAPCPRCGTTLARVAFSSHEVAYCPHCQCNDRLLADRRLSRLLR